MSSSEPERKKKRDMGRGREGRTEGKMGRKRRKTGLWSVKKGIKGRGGRSAMEG